MLVLQNILLNKEILNSEFIKNKIELTNNRLKEFEIIFYFLYHYNFRINEILKINLSDLIYDFKIIIHISKSNHKEIIRDEFIYKQIKNYLTNQNLQTFSCNYIQFYKWFYKFKSNYIIFKNKKNNKVTHTFRYKNTEHLLNYSVDTKVIKANLHHNSKDSQKFYIRKSKI
jgi:integrase